jgi:hypothetical protein
VAFAANNTEKTKTKRKTKTTPKATQKEPSDYQYEFFFRYGRKSIDLKDVHFTTFINRIVELSKAKGEVTVTIKGGASRVPTRKKGGNKRLATARANKFEAILISELTKKGVDVTKIKFVKNSIVGGPKYRGDIVLGRKKYEKHQYVKASAE